MSKFYIGFGGCSKYYLYILGTVIFKCLRDCIFGFNIINPESKIGLFGFVPELSNHYLIQSLYRYLSFIIGGALFIYILKKNSTNESDIINIKEKENLEYKGLIYNSKDDNYEIANFNQILKVGLIYCFHAELSRIMYLFDFGGLDIWTIDVIFILVFMHKNFVINFAKHQKYSMAFIIISATILLFISSFLPNSNHDDIEEKKEKDKNTYQIISDITRCNYAFIIIFIIFSLLSCLISYQRVKEKVLMDYYFLSPYKLIFFIGIFGFIITLIILIFTSIFACPTRIEYITDYCTNKHIKKNNEKYYYDNFLIYFEELKNNKNIYKSYLEILLISPIYIISSHSNRYYKLVSMNLLVKF